MGRAFSLVPLVACSVLLVQLCGAFGELGVHGKEAEKQDSDFGLLVDDLLSERPSGVQVLYQGAPFEDFERPLPRFVEQSAGQDFEVYLNQTQDFHPNGDNTYLADGQQFVVSIKNGRVSGVLGAVFDNRGRIFTELTPSVAGLPTTKEQLDATKCKHFKRLATTIQKYGQMYYHFIQEVIPRIILLRPFLNEETKVLTFGAPYEAAWLQYLGIPPEHMEVYDPTATYCADELLVPSPSAVIIPPKENYGLLRKVFKADPPLPVEQRDLIIYCSRKGASDRRVRNEDEILAAVAARFPNEKVQIFTGKESVSETVQIFKRAKIVIGMHGAGLSHSVFSAPGTALIEFLFMYNPPMMFWHAAAASGQRYFMVPLAQSWWLAPEAEIPTADVLDVLSLALDVPAGDCPLGHVKDAQTSKCVPCPAGTYRAAGASLCTPCAGGRIAADAGAAFCRTCPVNTFSDESRTQCVACSGDANTMFPGSPSEDSCHPVDELEYALDVMFDNENLAKKLVRLPALELPKPTSTLGWVSSLVSPKRMLRAHHMNQLRNQLLEDLFDADGLEQSDEDLEEGEEEHGEGGASRSLLQYQTRRLLQYDGERRRSLLQYDGERRRSLLQYDGERRRSLLQYDGERRRRSLLQYDGERRRSLLQYDGERRRSLLQYDGERRRRSLLQYDGERRRSLLQYDGERRRSLLQYDGERRRRSLLQYDGERRRSLLQYDGERRRRSLLQYDGERRRSLLQYDGERRRSLLQYDGERRRRSLLQYDGERRRALLSLDHGRQLLQYTTRRLSQYSRRLTSATSRGLLQYHRRLMQYSRRLLGHSDQKSGSSGSFVKRLLGR